MKLTLTPKLAHAAGTDAGNRSMRSAGRSSWAEDDYRTASRVKNALMDKIDRAEHRYNSIERKT